MFRVLLTCLLLFGVAAVAGDVATYGEPLTEDVEIVPISKLYASPDDYAGKTVKVEGRVIAVCAKRGCWMELAGDEEFQSMRIKVTDGVIVFPMESMGKVAVAEGVFTKIEIPAHAGATDPEHKCTEKHEGEEAAASSCQPKTAFQIMGTGAEIRPAEGAGAR